MFCANPKSYGKCDGRQAASEQKTRKKIPRSTSLLFGLPAAGPMPQTGIGGKNDHVVDQRELRGDEEAVSCNESENGDYPK